MESPTLRLRRIDAAHLELLEVLRLERIVSLFQPIVDARSSAIWAHEALSRGPSDSWLHTPKNLFDAAVDIGTKTELELLCLKNAINRFAAARCRAQLFVNVSPDSLSRGENFVARFLQLIDEAGLTPAQCTLELTEESLLDDYDLLRAKLAPLRDAGCELAIDDLGAGSSGLRTWSELRPDFVKIDRYFISGIDVDSTKLGFVRSIVDLSRAIGCRVIAEGVETSGECSLLIKLGVDGLQGHFFGHPRAELTAPQEIFSLPAAASSGAAQAIAADISTWSEPVEPQMLISDVVAHFRARPECQTVVVAYDKQVGGVIRRDQLFALLSRPLHAEIYNRRRVDSIMEAPILIDAHLRLDQVSRLVTESDSVRLAEEFVVVKDGLYFGIAKTIQLLRRITEQQLATARLANPLTLLPGNTAVHSHLQQLMDDGKTFVACYFDVDAFKPFNDFYGYARGDKVIQHFALILRDCFNTATDFLGHIGGDDFLVISQSEDWQHRARKVFAEFQSAAGSFYDAAEIAAGYISAAGRDGQFREFPLMSLSGAALHSRGIIGFEVDDFSRAIAALKSKAKQIPGNSLLFLSAGGVEEIVIPEHLPIETPTETLTSAHQAVG